MLTVLLLSSSARASMQQFRSTVWRVHPCAAWVIDREQGTDSRTGQPSWSTSVYNGGSHWRPGEKFKTWLSYGLGQAFPGTKMRSAGGDWLTNAWTQLRWALGYMVGRYGSECGAKAFWITHGWY